MACFASSYDHHAYLKIFIDLEYECKLNYRNFYYNYLAFPKIRF